MHLTCLIFNLSKSVKILLVVNVCFCRLAGDQRARRDIRHDSDAEDDDDVKKVKIETVLKNIFVSESDICVVFKSQAF